MTSAATTGYPSSMKIWIESVISYSSRIAVRGVRRTASKNV